MALQKFNIVALNGTAFFLQLDPQDMAQRDVIAHFLGGQMYEHETSLLFLRVLRSGDTAVDVGGNAGYFTMLAATAVGAQGRVVTAEANPGLAALIRDSAALNDVSHLFIENVAISDRNGEIVFGSNGTNDSNGGVVPEKMPGEALESNESITQFVARAETLDSLAERHGLERIRLLKIDTEGHELNVLKGAEGLLREKRIDFIAAELNLPGLARNRTNQHELRRFMVEHGYHMFLLDHGGDLPCLVPPGSEVRQTYTCNVLFSRIETVAGVWDSVANEPAAVRIAKR